GAVAARGEIRPWLEEMRMLVARPAFDTLPPEGPWSRPSWQVMRIDQMLRVDERQALERLVQLVYEVDALVAMADTVARLGFVIPEIVDGPLTLDAEGVYHPFVATPVPNPLQLDQSRRMLFVTGPNMAGKT